MNGWLCIVCCFGLLMLAITVDAICEAIKRRDD